MPYYKIKSSWERKGLLGLKPSPRLTGYQDIEAATARDAVLQVMAHYHEDINGKIPVKGSPVLHTWFLPGSVTISEYIDDFLKHQSRSFVFLMGKGNYRRILSVKETDTVECGYCSGTGLYQDTEDICFACKGDGQITPMLDELLNSDFGTELAKRGVVGLDLREQLDAERQIMDELQYGKRTLSSDGDSE